jgi:hypothetical protein
MALVPHHAAHDQPAPTGLVGESPGLVGRTPAARQTDVDVDEHVPQPGPGGRLDRLGRIDGDGDHRVVALCGGECVETVRVDHLVREEQVGSESGGRHPEHLAHGGAREGVVTVRHLAAGERGALVRLHVRSQCGRRSAGGHRREVRLEHVGVDQQRRGGQVVDRGHRRGGASCGRRESNPHSSRNRNLNPARLPVSPRPRRAESYVTAPGSRPGRGA